jgi:hypothetical protein
VLDPLASIGTVIEALCVWMGANGRADH